MADTNLIGRIVKTFKDTQGELISVIKDQISQKIDIPLQEMNGSVKKTVSEFLKTNQDFKDMKMHAEKVIVNGKEMVKMVATNMLSMREIVGGGLTSVKKMGEKAIKTMDFGAMIKGILGGIQSSFSSMGHTLIDHANNMRTANQRFMSKAQSHMNILIGGSMILIGAITAILGMLKPVQEMVKAINSVVQALFLPLGLLLMAMLIPVLILMAALLQTNIFKSMMSQVSNIIKFMVSISTYASKLMVMGINTITSISGVINAFYQFARDASGVFKGIVSGIYGFFHTFYTAAVEFFGIVKTMLKPFTAIASKIGNPLGSFFKGIASLDSGGSIISSGLAVVHKGETVIPAGGNTMAQGESTHIEIHIHGMDHNSAQSLADEVIRQIENRTGKSMRWA